LKIGTFVIGGLAGAALVMMFRRNARMSAFASSVGDNVKHRMSDWKDEAIDKALHMKFMGNGSRRGGGGDSRSDRSFRSSSSDEGGLDAIKDLISQDPAVGKEVDAILRHNEHPRN